MDLIEKLQHIVDVVLPVIREHDDCFHMDSFVNYKGEMQSRLPPDQVYPNCGTTMCVAGFAALDPMFNKMGFGWYRSPKGAPIRLAIHGIVGGLASVRQFFDLDRHDGEVFPGTDRDLFSTLFTAYAGDDVDEIEETYTKVIFWLKAKKEAANAVGN